VRAVAKLRVAPVTAERWADLERLFGPSGAYSGCWCMYLRVSSKEFAENGNAGNRARLDALVQDGNEPGLLAYDGYEPVGWVAVAPRDEYPRVLRSPLHKPIDDETGVWAVTCFFIARDHRGNGVGHALLDGAVKFAKRQRARIVEGYPIDPGDDVRPTAEMWRGSVTMFERAGFEVVARRKPLRPIVRLRLRTR
jgi:GNAT superfamily N-acetyltransferase